MKNVQQISTMLPIGLNDESSVCTTNFRPGALLITLNGLSDLNSLNTCEQNSEHVLITRCVMTLSKKNPILENIM